MNKTKIQIVGLVLFLFVAIMLPYVSLLGENDKSLTVVRAYFTNISSKKFSDNKILCTARYNDSFSDLSELITNQFGVETTLLDHFKIPVDGKYSLKIKRDRLWYPFGENGTLKLSIRVNSLKRSNSLVAKYFQFDTSNLLQDFIVMKRVEGLWRIDSIDVDNPLIHKTYKKTKDLMDNSVFISEKQNTIIIHEKEMDLSGMDVIEKRILTFQLNKILNLINQKK